MIKKLTDSVFQRNLYIAIGERKQCQRKLQKMFDYEFSELNDPQALALTLHIEDDQPGGKQHFITWIPKLSRKTEDVSLLMHELLHLTYSALSYVTIDLNDKTEEVYAYYLDSLVSQVWDLKQ